MICKSTPYVKVVEHYYMENYLAKPVEPESTVGLSNFKIIDTGNELFCSFTRENQVKAKNYFNITEKKFTKVFGAFGEIARIFKRFFFIIKFPKHFIMFTSRHCRFEAA